MMLFSLLKKDFLIVKKYVLIICPLSIIISISAILSRSEVMCVEKKTPLPPFAM